MDSDTIAGLAGVGLVIVMIGALLALALIPEWLDHRREQRALWDITFMTGVNGFITARFVGGPMDNDCIAMATGCSEIRVHKEPQGIYRPRATAVWDAPNQRFAVDYVFVPDEIATQP